MRLLSTIRRRRAISVLVGVLALTLLALAISFQGAPVSSAAPVFSDIGAFKYGIYKDEDGSLHAAVLYPHDSRADLEAYAATNRNLLDQLAKQTSGRIDVSIVLARPLDPADLPQMVARYGIDVDRYLLRALAPSGERITITGAPAGGELVPATYLQSAVKGIQDHTSGARLLGIITIEGHMNAGDAVRLAQDKQIYLVDVSAEAVRRQAHAQYGDAPIQIDNLVQIYWFLENTGLASNQP